MTLLCVARELHVYRLFERAYFCNEYIRSRNIGRQKCAAGVICRTQIVHIMQRKVLRLL